MHTPTLTNYFLNNFYKLQLNTYRSTNFDKIIPSSNIKKFASHWLRLTNGEALFKFSTKTSDIRFLDFYSFYWKLQRLHWFGKHCRISILQKNVLMIAESENLFNLIFYFAKKHNQQYVFSWIPGLLSNAANIQRFAVQKCGHSYLINLTKNFEFILLIENTDKMVPAFREVISISSGFPFVLFSANDNFFLPATGFLTSKDETRVYFYLSLFFSFFYKLNTYYTSNLT